MYNRIDNYMKLIFDFDYTLFRANKLREAIQDFYHTCGVMHEVIQTTLETSRMGGWDWKPEVQLALLSQESGIDSGACRQGFNEIVRDCGKFLYDDVLPVLRELQNRHELYIISHGEDSFQNAKVNASGIGDFFQAVIITGDVTKVDPLSKIIDNEGKNSVFIEDNPLALVESKKAFPRLTTVRINRGEGRYAEKLDDSSFNFVIRDLFELQKIIIPKL